MKPNLGMGVAISELERADLLLGQVDGEDVLLAHAGDEYFAVGASCTHYHGPLADGLIVGDTVRCPLHHACFSLRTGEALRAPALDPIACWKVERRGERLFVTEKLPPPAAKPTPPAGRGGLPASVIVVGGGAAGLAAADMLRRDGYDDPIAIISADSSPPCDRPNLSKEYLSGEAPEDWIPLRPPEYYTDNRIELVLDMRVSAIDASSRRVRLSDGSSRPFGALLVATGAEPITLSIPGANGSRVHYLRSFADSRAIVASAGAARHVVIVGASFIGLEVAASLRIRNIAVDVVAPEAVPLERILGAEIGRFVRQIHEDHGVVFHLGETLARMNGRSVTLSGGGVVEADFLVMGVGVRPAVSLAEHAGLAVDRGILVDEYLETSVSGIFAAGDAARWLDRRSGERRRVEHWVVAQRQGQVAARNMLGRREAFDAIPFFWSQHYDTTIRYCGHAERWDRIQMDGTPASGSCAATYIQGDRRLAVATIGRDRACLEAELAMEHESSMR